MARMNLKWRAILAGLFIIAVFAAACGGGGKGGSSSKGSDEDQIKQTVADFANAFNTGKADDAYNLMDAASRKACSQQDVATLLTLIVLPTAYVAMFGTKAKAEPIEAQA